VKNRKRRKRRGETKGRLKEAEAMKPNVAETGGDEALEGRDSETSLILLTREERLAEAEAFVAQMREELESERLIEAAERLRVESQTPSVVLPSCVSSFFPVLESVEEAMVIEDDDPDKIDWRSPKKE
jgi:hypothetical protein